MRPRICISDRFPDTADTTLKIHTLRTTALINISIVVQSISLVQLFMTPRTVARQPPLSWDFPGKNTGMGCHILLQGISQTRRLSPHLLHWQVDSFPLSHQGSPVGRRQTFLATAQPMRDCHDSANEKPLHFKLPVSSNGHFV